MTDEEYERMKKHDRYIKNHNNKLREDKKWLARQLKEMNK